jgi:decaprenylphospho-beta-D-ribofuranose 2-oxidase
MLSNGIIETCFPDTDLFKTTCGGMGLTGIITSVKLKLKKIDTTYIKQKKVKANTISELFNLMQHNKHYNYMVAWIDCLNIKRNKVKAILTCAEHATKEDLLTTLQKQSLQYKIQKNFSIPFRIAVLNKYFFRVFNFIYYASNKGKINSTIVSINSFFYPLDKLFHWNYLYGKKGFLQYQFLLPLNAEKGMEEIINKISTYRKGSFLAVIKLLGATNNYLSFATEGYTLAVDFPMHSTLFTFLNELDELVTKYGGRIYLSKDARSTCKMFYRGYNQIKEFKLPTKKYDNQNKFQSLLSSRLFLKDY